jgi:hypothetical protein
MKFVPVLLCLLSFNRYVNAQVSFDGYENLFTTPLSYKAYQVKDPMQIDGDLNEDSWQSAKWSEYFTDIEGEKKPKPPYKTRFKMLWDKDNAYIAAELEDADIWASYTKRDAPLYLENDFEFFVDPDADTHNYIEFEVNVLKNVFDLFFDKSHRDGGDALTNWDLKNLKLGVKVAGTVNKPKDHDKKWTVEMSFPFRSVTTANVAAPVDQTIWRFNFLRVQWDYEIVNGQYKKKTDASTGKSLPEHNWSWSPQGLINMHVPERWGYVQFIAQPAGAPVTPFEMPASEQPKNYLRLIYYKEHDFQKKNGAYTASLQDLNFPVSFQINGNSYTATLEATTHLFEAIIKDETTNEAWKITDDGEVKKMTR